MEIKGYFFMLMKLFYPGNKKTERLFVQYLVYLIFSIG